MGTTTVADALFTKVQQRVPAVLFGNVARSFYAREIIALAGSGTGAVQRELARLESVGLVTATRIGRQKHYRANPAASMFAELRSLVRKTSGLADGLRAALAPLAPEIRAAFVFGSVATHEDTAAIDVDLLVVSERLTYAELHEALQPAARHIGRMVNPTVVTAAELARRVEEENAFITRALESAKLWLLGGPDDLRAR